MTGCLPPMRTHRGPLLSGRPARYARRLYALSPAGRGRGQNRRLTQRPSADNIMTVQKHAMNGKSTRADLTERGREPLEAALWEAGGRCVREREG